MIALLILVFVDAQDAATPLPGALARAVEEVLGADVTVSTRTLTAGTPMAALADTGRAEHAAFVAQVAWKDERRVEAHLTVTSVDGNLTRSSAIGFDASDPLAERGRALGLVLAALVASEKRARAEREPARAVPPAPTEAVVAAGPPSPSPSPRRFALDAAAGGGVAVGGAGSGVGGSLGLRWHAGRRIALRAGAQARFGELAVAQAAAMDLAAAAGVALFVIAPAPAPAPADDRRFALALRADALLLYQSLSHLSDDDVAPVRGARLLPGALVLVEGQWAISPTLALVLGAGPEIVFGTTDVFVRQQKVAELAPFRLVAQGGLVARF